MESQTEPQSIEMDLLHRKPPSVEAPSVEDLLKEVSSVLSDTDVFAIGGHIQDETKLALRWEGYPHTLRLPAHDIAAQDSFNALLNFPATMDANDFCTDFNPYAHGILDAINQALTQSKYTAENEDAVKAELCKLEVSSASLGELKPHVDNTRSDRQMGILVVCLPSPHRGGQLLVRNQGQQVEFDWASKHPDTVQWAAFFSDCETEIQPITEGHRLTLTYNLLWTKYAPALMSTELNVLDQESLQFYTGLKGLLKKMESTGEQYIVGFTCRYAYPHTSTSWANGIHHILRGIDMVVYQALQQNLRKVRVGMVVDDSSYVAEQLNVKKYQLECEAKGDTKYPLIYDKSDLENTVCMSEESTPTWVWETWPESEKDCMYFDPTYASDEFTREKVNWLNCAPNERDHMELSLVMPTTSDGHTEYAEYDSFAVIFGWVGFENESEGA